jgi:glycosyltransferase involved in cell wall biosynthesis
MRIALLTTLIYDNPTARSFITGLARGYSEAGHAVSTAGRYGPWLGRERPERQKAAWGEVWRMRDNPGPGLERLARGSDWIHLHLIGRWDPLLAKVSKAAAAAGTRIAATFQDFGNPPLGDRDARRLGDFLARCHRVTALSKSSARLISTAWPGLAGRLRVIGNGWEPRSGRPSARLSRPFVLCASRLLPYKGIDVLLVAWRDLGLDRKDFRLVLCGADYGDPHYKNLAAGLGLGRDVRFMGEVGPRRLLGLMRSCSFLVLPSRHEAFGMAAIEAMSCGKPVIATRSGGPQEIISHGREGLLTPPFDPKRLAAGIGRLIADAGLRRRLGEGARRKAERFRWPEITRRYLDLMEPGVA